MCVCFTAQNTKNCMNCNVKHLEFFWDGNFEENQEVQDSETPNFYIQNSSIFSFLYGLGSS